MSDRTPHYIFAGLLQRETILLPSGKALVDVLGGNVLYAAVGSLVWEKDPPPGIMARVGEDYPQSWLELCEQRGIDTRGVRILPEALDVRSFTALTTRHLRSSEEPISHFSRLGLPFPRLLLGFRDQSAALNSRTQLLPTSLRQADLYPDYMDAGAAHLCPMDYLTHSLVPALLRQAAFTIVTIDPSPGYMNPTFWGDLPKIVTGLTAFIPSEEDLRCLFQGRSENLWEMIEAVAAYDCEIVIVKRGEGGQMLYDSTSRSRWEIPAYDSRVVDPSGAGNAFCGGFLSGFRRTYDPLQATLYGNISASLVVEGSGPFFALEALPGLAQARLEAIRPMVRRI